MTTAVPNIISKIEEKLKKCSKGQRAIGEYITSQYDKAAFMTAAKLAKVTNVSESTVVRFAFELGYSGYPELQTALQEIVRVKITSYQRMELALDKIGVSSVLESILQADMERIRQTLETINEYEFNKAVDMILEAGTIYILGVGSASVLVDFMAVYFNMIFDNIKIIRATNVSEIFEQLLKIKSTDVIIGVSFPRYSKRTIKALRFAKDSGASVVTVTDSTTSPVNQYADVSLIGKSDMTSFVDSLVAPLSVVNALIIAITMKKKQEVYNTLEKLENIWDEYEVYEKN